MNKKHFVRIFAGFALGLAGATLLPGSLAAAPTSRVAVQAGAVNPLDEGVYLLKRGKRFETAITYFRAAVADRPSDHRARLMLACAQASRAAALSKAVASLPEWEKDKAKYRKRLEEETTATTTQPSQGSDVPVAPILRTKDDQKPFTSTASETRTHIIALLKDALASADAGVDLAPTDDATRAEARYLRGWVRFLVLRLPENARLAVPVAQDQVKADFAEATRLAPQEAAYYQSSGDVFRHVKSVKDALPLYQKSLDLRKKNPDLWRLMFELQKETAPAVAEASLRKAITQSPSSTALWFRLGYFLCQRGGTPFVDEEDQPQLRISNKQVAQKVLDAVKNGAQASEYAPVIPTSATPDVLITAWNYNPLQEGYAPDLLEFFSFSIALANSHKSALKNGDIQAATDYAQASLALGAKMANSVPEEQKEFSVDDFLNLTFGMTTLTNGYFGLINICKTSGDLAGATVLRNEFAKKVDTDLRLRSIIAQRNTRFY